MTPSTCVNPDGNFIFGIHKPSFRVENLRSTTLVDHLGKQADGSSVDNRQNFPQKEVTEEQAIWIYEIPNPFPFRGATFIKKDWADVRARNPASIKLPTPAAVSLSESLSQILGDSDREKIRAAFSQLPHSLLLATATTSTDPEDLIRLAIISCTFIYDPDNGVPTGIAFKNDSRGEISPDIFDHALFEALTNNPFLPNIYKNIMVLKPGIQGTSEIIGEYGSADGNPHVFEYLRRNSYIPWGHYAANMANDSVRYAIDDLSPNDISGLRHLYYQRTYCRLAEEYGIAGGVTNRPFTGIELEALRTGIIAALAEKGPGQFNSTLWGWNFGFDFAPSQYRLHASHQQIHQQYAMVPGSVEDQNNAPFKTYSCGDLIAAFCSAFRQETGRPFFECYLEAIRTNTRIDGRTDLPATLTVFEDDQVILFVPKAQTSKWELQLMCIGKIGTILECDTATRNSLDQAILMAQRALAGLGARLVTTIEYSRRFDEKDNDQRLLYSFLPKLPESPGAFSEAQLRFISGHYPEDFAEACRLSLRRDNP